MKFGLIDPNHSLHTHCSSLEQILGIHFAESQKHNRQKAMACLASQEGLEVLS